MHTIQSIIATTAPQNSLGLIQICNLLLQGLGHQKDSPVQRSSTVPRDPSINQKFTSKIKDLRKEIRILRQGVNSGWLVTSQNLKDVSAARLNSTLHGLQIQYELESNKLHTLGNQLRHLQNQNAHLQSTFIQFDRIQQKLEEEFNQLVQVQFEYKNSQTLCHHYNQLRQRRIELERSVPRSIQQLQRTYTEKQIKLKELRINLVQQDIYIKNIREVVRQQQDIIDELELELSNAGLEKIRRFNRVVRRNTENIEEMRRRNQAKALNYPGRMDSSLELAQTEKNAYSLDLASSQRSLQTINARKLVGIGRRRSEQQTIRPKLPEVRRQPTKSSEDAESSDERLFKPIKIQKEQIILPRTKKPRRKRNTSDDSSSTDSDVFAPTRLKQPKVTKSIRQQIVVVEYNNPKQEPKHKPILQHSRKVLPKPKNKVAQVIHQQQESMASSSVSILSR